MLARWMSASLIVTVSFASAWAQTSPTAHDKNQDSRLDAIEKKLSDQDEKLNTLTDKIDRLVNGISDQKGQIESLRTGISELKDIVNQGFSKHEKNLSDISQSEGGRYVPRISAAMAESESFRRDMAQAVNRSIQPTGKLLVTNKTAYFQWIAVNMKDYGVGPGERFAVDVPVGTVTTQMPGQAMTNWTVTAPSYEEYVDIVPPYMAARPVTDLPGYSSTLTYPSAATYTSPPVYVDPAVYVQPVTWSVAYR